MANAPKNIKAHAHILKNRYSNKSSDFFIIIYSNVITLKSL